MWDVLGMTAQGIHGIPQRHSHLYDRRRPARVWKSYFTTTGFMPDAQKGAATGSRRKMLIWPMPTWPVPKLPDQRFCQARAGLFRLPVRKALVAWLDKHPEIDWISWRSGNRPNSRKMLAHHGERFLGNYTYVDLYDLMSQVAVVPLRCLAAYRDQDHGNRSPSSTRARSDGSGGVRLSGTMSTRENGQVLGRRRSTTRGHLYMYPAQATGRFPYSIIEYPTMGGSYLSPVQPETTGVHRIDLEPCCDSSPPGGLRREGAA